MLPRPRRDFLIGPNRYTRRGRAVSSVVTAEADITIRNTRRNDPRNLLPPSSAPGMFEVWLGNGNTRWATGAVGRHTGRAPEVD